MERKRNFQSVLRFLPDILASFNNCYLIYSHILQLIKKSANKLNNIISDYFLGKFMTNWRGIILLKDPLSLTINQQLLWELKPQTVIEFGAYKGGSALWTADMLKIFECQSRVISIDIDLSLLDAAARSSPHVEFIQGDLLQVEKCLPEEFLKVLLLVKRHL